MNRKQVSHIVPSVRRNIPSGNGWRIERREHKKEFSIGLNAMAQTSFFMLSLLTYGLMPQLSDPKISSTLILMLHKILELKARQNMYILLWVLHYFSGGRSRAQYSSFTSRCLIGTFHRMLMVQGAI